MKKAVYWIFFAIGILLGIAMLVPLVVSMVDMFWYLVTGHTLWMTWSAERVMLTTVWLALTLVFFVWAQRK